MKIMHIISGGDVGGAKTAVLSLVSGLSRTEQVRLVCFLEGPFSQEARELGIDTAVLPSRHVLRVAKALAKEINDGGYEIVHCHGSRANLIGALLMKRVRAVTVTTVHSDPRLDYLGRPFRRLTYGNINALCLRRFPYHIAVSNAMAGLLISRGFDPQTMFSIYNGVNFTPPRPAMERDAYFASVGLRTEKDSVVFGLAARFSPVKDLPTLLRGFARAVRNLPSIRLILAGDGEMRGELTRLAKELCPEGTVCFAGWVADMESFYNAIDVNLLTSLTEAFPCALPEGARHSLATIATPVGGVPDIIEDGVTGLIFPVGDDAALAARMETLARDAALRAQLGANLRERSKRDFSNEAILARQLEIYRVLLRRAARPKKKRDGVLICGAYGKGNAGDDAILEAIAGQMRGIDPDMPLYVLTRTPKQTEIRYRIGAVHTFNVPGFLRVMRRTKLYLNGGGSLIQDVTSTRSLRYYLASIRLAKLTGNRVLMYGCGIGPVRRAGNVRAAARTIDRCADAVTLREGSSRAELERMGVSRPEIRVTADPALLIEGAEPARVAAWMKKNGLEPDGAYAMFVLRPWKGFSPEAFAGAAARVRDELGLEPVFLALEPGRDIAACENAASRAGGGPKVLPVPAEGALIVGILGRMRVVVSMRLHALIFAAAAGTPVVGAVYDPKVQAFLEHLGKGRYLPLSEATAPALFDAVRETLAGGAAAEVGRLRALAAENQAVAKRLLEESK